MANQVYDNCAAIEIAPTDNYDDYQNTVKENLDIIYSFDIGQELFRQLVAAKGDSTKKVVIRYNADMGNACAAWSQNGDDKLSLIKYSTHTDQDYSEQLQAELQHCVDTVLNDNNHPLYQNIATMDELAALTYRIHKITGSPSDDMNSPFVSAIPGPSIIASTKAKIEGWCASAAAFKDEDKEVRESFVWLMRHASHPSAGSTSSVTWDPSRVESQGVKRDIDIALFHELCHALSNMKGVSLGAAGAPGKGNWMYEASITGLKPFFHQDPLTENAYRDAKGVPLRTEYK